MKAAMGRDLAMPGLPGALVPSGGTQEALKCALSLFVIRLSALFTEEETEAWRKHNSLAQGHTLHRRQSHHPLGLVPAPEEHSV